MAITENVTKKTLLINVVNGYDDEGEAVIKTYTYSGIKNAAAAEGMYAVGAALGGLMDKDLDSVGQTETSELTEQAL